MYHEICVWFEMWKVSKYFNLTSIYCTAKSYLIVFSRLSVLACTTKKEVINNDDLEFVLAMIVVNEALESVNVQF